MIKEASGPLNDMAVTGAFFSMQQEVMLMDVSSRRLNERRGVYEDIMLAERSGI